MDIDVKFDNFKELISFVRDMAPLLNMQNEVPITSATLSPADTKTIEKAAAAKKKPAEKAEASAPVNSPAPTEAPQKAAEAPAAKPKHSAADVRTLLFELNKAATGDAPRTVNKAKDVIHALGFNSFKDVPEEKYDDLYAKAEEAMKALKELDHAG